MNITHRKALFFFITALITGIASILLRNEPYIDLLADVSEFLYVIFIFSSISRILSTTPSFLRALPLLLFVLILSPRRFKDIFPWLTHIYVSYPFLLTYACFSFMVAAPIVEICVANNESKQHASQDFVKTHCKFCNSSMLYQDVFCPKCSKLSADMIDFLQTHPNSHHLDFTLDIRHDYLYCPFCDMGYGSTRYASTHNALSTPIYRCGCGAYLINHHYTEWSVVPASKRFKYCFCGGYFVFVIGILVFFLILSLPDMEYMLCAFLLLLYATILRILWLRRITAFDIRDSYKRLEVNPHYPQILKHMAYEHLDDSYRHAP